MKIILYLHILNKIKVKHIICDELVLLGVWKAIGLFSKLTDLQSNISR